ncbi:NADH-quinone oxidoreductase subunit L [Chengkuizengella axinellae]|uniref:NADH-quinone oxidoreductase subunit L n=1 Tax=Chengkuizengella axinellae TaxID=3064388 RepID=A0ABT9J5S8_9BACL|nr:NADH-quinone oxidoreductase subunit L [Chengkuizengella sp. 2205SS18-9]MDP5276838.1 NADH-quinone oxidoreductase subunit L [Chengkuizengella sp. 2205SS18-9]
METVFSQIAWLIPLFPLIAFIILIAIGKQGNKWSSYISIGFTLLSFILAFLVLIERLNGTMDAYTWNEFDWLSFGDISIKLGFEINNLNAMMLIVVTLVSLLVNLYSKAYMKDDARITVFFSYISLFTFSMLGLVISVNLLELYIFWELVGVCSFLLIGFWYEKESAKAAAKKAFIVTRIGDVGLFIAILLLFWYMPNHSLDFTDIHNAFSTNSIPIEAWVVTLIAILIFVGAMGKSGQFPLHTWLPDAMEGPTPISALIHAATMVAAGVYLVARTYDIFLASSIAMEVVAYVGGFTAIFAATIAIAQNDFKRILAYSTVSQLGYMMLALGIGAYTAGIFHLFTHAFFKALLFLGAGSVIHALHKQDIREMGGIWKSMKVTSWTFVIGALALSGIPPFSGFWSKEAILTEAYIDNKFLFIIGITAAFFTAFYMTRLFKLAFMGDSRAGNAPKESPFVMTLPLIVLCVLAIIAGFVFTPWTSWLGEWLTGDVVEEHTNWIVMIISIIVALAGIVLGWIMFGEQSKSSQSHNTRNWAYKLLENRYYIDELYHWIIVKPLRGLGLLLNAIDRFIVDGIVKLTANIMLGTGRVGTSVQNGQVQTYGLVTLIGFIIIIAAMLGRRYF